MKIRNKIVGGLVGIILAACGPGPKDNSDAGNTDSQDAGYVDSGFPDGNYIPDASVDGGSDGGNVSDGGSDNLPPVVIIEAKDQEGNVKDEFEARQWVIYDLNKSYDPDCESKGTCGLSKGLKYCDCTDNILIGGKIYFADMGSTGTKSVAYGDDFKGQQITFSATCYNKDDNLSTTSTKTIKIKN